MAWMWLGPNTEEAPVGRWDPDPNRPGKWLYDPTGDPVGQEPAVTQMLPVIPPFPDYANPVAHTAGEQDHTDPWRYASDDADAPVNP